MGFDIKSETNPIYKFLMVFFITRWCPGALSGRAPHPYLILSLNVTKKEN